MDSAVLDPEGLTEAGRSPLFALGGFNGPLALLVTLARARQIDLTRIPLRELVDQLTAALTQTTSLGEKGDWVVMAAWLVLLRSRLLLPEDTPAQEAAETQADRLRGRLVALHEMQALAAWLDHRPLLGRDVFIRGQPELAGPGEHAVDVVEFLWASLALFDDGEMPDTASHYRPLWFDLHSVPDARDRILLRLAAAPEGQTLDRLLPPASPSVLRQRSAWASTFTASLELAKQGVVRLVQEGGFTPIQVTPAPA
jgi:segregation and condensation protein A